jgi:general secretion pathway protein A
MFLDYYGLRENPFGVVADTRFLYLSPTHYNALNALYHGLNNGQEFLALVAQPGTGKTTVLRRLAPQLGVRVVSLSLTNSGTREVIGCLLASLGVDSTDHDLLWMHERLNEVLRNEARSSHRFVLILDEAQNLATSTIEALRLLSNFETPNEKLIQTVLVGQPSLADALARPEHEQLRQRLSVVARLEALPNEEVSKYIDFRLRVAGYNGQPLFTASACKAIAGWSGGIPRRINSICFNALSFGHAANKRQIDGKTVRKAISTLDIDGLTTEAQSAEMSGLAAGLDRTPWIGVAAPLLLVVTLIGSLLYLGGLNRWKSSAASPTIAQNSLAESLPVSATAPELPLSSRSGSDFVELPRIVPPSVVSSAELENKAPKAAPAKVKLAKVEPLAIAPKEVAGGLNDASDAAVRSSIASHDAARDKILSDVKQGDGYMRGGDYEKALREFQAALVLDPGSHSLRAKIEAVRRAKATEARVLQ